MHMFTILKDQLNIHHRTDKNIVVYSHDGILYSNDYEQTTTG